MNNLKYLFFFIPFIFSTIASAQVVGSHQLVSYYDLRERESFIQISNIGSTTAFVQVTIFRNDQPNCSSISFFDALTPKDTHIYNMRDLSPNNGNMLNISLDDLSNGFVLVSLVESINSQTIVNENKLIGNFRIVDSAGYEYKINSIGNNLDFENTLQTKNEFILEFDQTNGNILADIVGIVLSVDNGNFTNNSTLEFLIGVFDENENSTQCDTVEFSCGESSDSINFGINNIFPSSRGDDILCQGSLHTIGFLELTANEELTGDKAFIGFGGLNNGTNGGSIVNFVQKIN